jgi:hypothetical protein
MRDAWKVTSTVLLSVLALGCATVAAYSLSILWDGHWIYGELAAPICGLMVVTVLALGVVALINRRHRGKGAVARLAAFLAVGCFTAAGVLFFGLLMNCSLSCRSKIVAESRSPDGRWKAISFSRNCVAIAGYCPAVSHVSILPATERLPGGDGNVFTVVGEGGIILQWKSDNVLSVQYYGPILRQQKHVRGVRVDYLPTGMM